MPRVLRIATQSCKSFLTSWRESKRPGETCRHLSLFSQHSPLETGSLPPCSNSNSNSNRPLSTTFCQHPRIDLDPAVVDPRRPPQPLPLPLALALLPLSSNPALPPLPLALSTRRRDNPKPPLLPLDDRLNLSSRDHVCIDPTRFECGFESVVFGLTEEGEDMLAMLVWGAVSGLGTVGVGVGVRGARGLTRGRGERDGAG